MIKRDRLKEYYESEKFKKKRKTFHESDSKIKNSVNSARPLKEHVNQYGGYENSPEEHVKYDPGYENTQGEHVKQNLTSDRYDSDSEEVSTDLAILKLLMEPGQNYTQKDIIAKTGKSRPTIWKYLKELERKKLIKFINLGKFKNYETTKRGESYYHERYVNPVHRGMKIWVRIHNVRLKGDLSKRLPNHMEEWKVFFNTWKGYTREFSDNGSIVTVNLTPKSAILHFSVAACPTRDEAETRLGNMVGWIITKLAQEGIYIKNLCQNTKASYALIYDPIAEEFLKHKITYDGKDFSIDHSHDIPETEFHTKEGFKRYQKTVNYIGDGSIDPEILKEMQKDYQKGTLNEKFKSEEKELLNKYDEKFILQIIPYNDIKIMDFVNKFKNNNKVVDMLYILEKNGIITASPQGYMRKV